MNIRNQVRNILGVVSFCFMTTLHAGTPLWTLTPLTSTTLSLPANETATVQYVVTNQSNKIHTLQLSPIKGVTQVTAGNGICHNPFALQGKQSCVLSLQIDGSQINQTIIDGPTICQQGSAQQCYRPSSLNILRVTKAAPISSATISVSGSPLTFTTNGAPSSLTITNTSNTITATNIMSDFTGTALDGLVNESGNTCNSVPPLASCSILYVPGNTAVGQTNFSIQGSNTNAITAAMQIDLAVSISNVSPANGAALGGTSVTITGTGLTGTSNLTFGGTPATSIKVVNSTTVTAVTPAHAVGAVDVEITTAGGSDTASNGYTYLATAVGQQSFGGVIACLGGGLNNLIAATSDNSAGVIWGSVGIATSATSGQDGAANTNTIVASMGQTTPNASTICESYEVDSQGNSPCSIGNTCYADWFLPATSQLGCLETNKDAIGGFSAAGYWGSTENNANTAWQVNFVNAATATVMKNTSSRVRCVRQP